MHARNSLEEANLKYKAQDDKKRIVKEFEVDDQVMAHLGRDKTPVGSYSKLQDRK